MSRQTRTCNKDASLDETLELYRQARRELQGAEQEIERARGEGGPIPEAITHQLEALQTSIAEQRNALTRRLNDRLRTTLTGGRVVMTAGVQGRGESFLARALAAVRAFDAFDADDDPYGEHDFGALEIEEARLFWKIDAYDPRGEYGSEDPADPAMTLRVLTLMLAEEY